MVSDNRAQVEATQGTDGEPITEQTVQTDSVVRRKDVPPGEVSRLLTTGSMGGGNADAFCTLNPHGVLTRDEYSSDHGIGSEGCVLPVGGDLAVALKDFPSEPLDILVRRPDGGERTSQILPDSSHLWSTFSWSAFPGDPLGDYALHVNASGITTSTSFSVGVGIYPLLRVEPVWGPPGTTFKLYLGSYPPSATAAIYLYRSVGADYLLWSDVGSVTLDNRGEAVVNLPTSTEDDLAEYRVWTVPKMRTISILYAPSFQLSSGPEWLPGDPPDELVRTFVQMANDAWASVVARDGAPIEFLECVNAGPWLDTIREDVVAMRSAGQYRVARMTAPVEIVRLEQSDYARHVVVVREHWDDKLFDASGALLQTASSTLEQRYVLERWAKRGQVALPGTPNGCDQVWAIVESEIIR